MSITRTPSHQPMATYQYSPVDDRTIRLVTLLPGTPADTLSVHLHAHSLDDAAALPDYEALSYVWGSPGESFPVTVAPPSPATIDGGATLTVPRNLHEALLHLRGPAAARTMWIDALCINQQDLGERAAQVQHMGALYRGAARVVVWLGPEADDSARALELVAWYAAHVAVDWRSGTLTATPSAALDASWFGRDVALAINDRGPGLVRLVLRPWFRRCGAAVVPWKVLKDVAFWLGTKEVHYYPDVVADLERNAPALFAMGRVRELGEEVPRGLFATLSAAVLSSCTDPRDRIYGMLNMLSDEDRRTFPIVADYTVPMGNLYRGLALAWLERRKSLDFLTYAGLHHPQALHDGKFLLTWVPNWTARCPGVKTALPNAGGTKSNTLLAGFSDLRDAFWAVRKAETAYQGTVPAARDTGDDMVFDEARAFMQATFDEDRGTSRTMNAVEARCLTVFRNRQQRGMVGDVFCVLPGCPSLLLLTPAPTIGDGRGFAEVGEAYVDGFMNGEGIFGPLPAGWTAVWRDSPDASEVVPAFLQDVESVPTWDDPRLFARGFLSEKMKESVTWKEALERRMTLTPDVLSSKGVPLVDIDLV
ncbi:Heterokaryon incompatibility protein 6 like [Verticillium longisporum]|nr:Heterokaryon incompatibility protein 6 like [Verticillium longisporum]